MTFSKYAAIVGLFMFVAPMAVAEESPLDKAWARVVASEIAGEDPRGKGLGVRHWFLGFVEGKTGVEPPEFWRESVLHCHRMKGTPQLFFGGGKFETPYHWTKDYIECPRDTDIVFGDGTVEIKVGADSIVLFDAKMIADIKGTEALSTLWTEDRVYVALQESVFSCEIRAVERESKKTIWTAKIKPSDFGPFALTGQTTHYVSMSTQGKNIVVYGAALFTGYVACIEAESGKVAWEFNTDIGLSAENNGAPKDPIDSLQDADAVAEIIELIENMPDWPLISVATGKPTDETEQRARGIEEMCAKIDYYKSAQIRQAMEMLLARVSGPDRHKLLGKMLILNMYLFDIPEEVPPEQREPFVTGYHSTVLGEVDGVEVTVRDAPVRWPWSKAEDGNLHMSREIHVLLHTGNIYPALARFDYYLEKYGREAAEE